MLNNNKVVYVVIIYFIFIGREDICDQFSRMFKNDVRLNCTYYNDKHKSAGKTSTVP